jgi:EmrB/QacA subfamily drug resistance transporter
MKNNAKSKAHKWSTMLLASVAVFMLMLDLTVVNVALPQIKLDLHASFSDLQWVIDAYAVALAAFLLLWGSLADLKGRKKVFLTALGFFTISSLACGLSKTSLELILSRGVEGVAAAALFAVGPALLGHEFRGKDRAMAFSVFGGMGGLAIALGPLIGGFLTNSFGWRWIFFVNIPIGVVALTLGLQFLPDSRRYMSLNPSQIASGIDDSVSQNDISKLDLIGVFFFALTAALLVIGLVEGSSNSWLARNVLAELVGSFAAFLIFLSVEWRRKERAAFPLWLFKNRAFNGISIVAFIANAVIIPMILLEALYVESSLHLNAFQAGVRFLPLTLSLFIAAAVTGGLIGKISVRPLFVLSMLMTGIGLYLVTLLNQASDWTALIPSMIVTGIGIGMVNPVRAATAIAITEPGLAGTSSAINETFQQLGPAVGVAGMGAIFISRVSSSFASLPIAKHLSPSALSAIEKSLTAGSTGVNNSKLSVAAIGQGINRVSLTQASRLAYLDGMHFVMLICAALSVLAAVLAAFLIRRKDMYSEVSLIPPDLEGGMPYVETDERDLYLSGAGLPSHGTGNYDF